MNNQITAGTQTRINEATTLFNSKGFAGLAQCLKRFVKRESELITQYGAWDQHQVDVYPGALRLML